MCPFISILDHERPTVEENENETNALNVNIAKAIGKAYNNKWFEGDNLDAMFAAQVRMDDE